MKKELITIKDGTPILSAEIATQITDFERIVKRLKEKEEKLKELILDEMESKGIIKIDTPELAITYVAPTDRERFDSKQLRSECPDVYDAYVTMTPVKASIRVKVKG